MEKTQDVEKLFIERIVSSPMECYSDFHQRFKDYGQMAPFPEFKEVANFLIDELSSDFCKDTIIRHPVLRYELNEVMTFLTHVNLVFDVEDTETYPYEIPFVEPYPYRPTLDAIEAALRLLDKINRLDEKGKAV